MKKIVFTTLAILLLNIGFAQKQTGDFSFDFVNGISLPIGEISDFSKDGFNSGVVINKNCCGKLSIGLMANYTSLPLSEEFGVSNKKWNGTSINIGPQYNLEFGDLRLRFYGNLGVSFSRVPEINTFYPNTNIVTRSFEESNNSSLNTRFGTNFGVEICKGLRFFINTEYVSNLNGKIIFGRRDISTAVDDNGFVDLDLASKISFNTESLSMSFINVSFGINIAINGLGQQTRATDYNSSRSNRTTSSSVLNSDEEEEGDTTRATDYNSSRSNRTTSSSVLNSDDEEEGDTNRATDYNSSRSNRTTSSSVLNSDDEEGGDTTRAADYNSSRSNRTTSSSVLNSDDEEEGDTTRATDYNSSRSNRTTSSSVLNSDDQEEGDNTRAADYDSSKSNKSLGIDLDNDNVVDIKSAKEKRKERKRKRKEKRKKTMFF